MLSTPLPYQVARSLDQDASGGFVIEKAPDHSATEHQALPRWRQEVQVKGCPRRQPWHSEQNQDLLRHLPLCFYRMSRSKIHDLWAAGISTAEHHVHDQIVIEKRNFLPLLHPSPMHAALPSCHPSMRARWDEELRVFADRDPGREIASVREGVRVPTPPGLTTCRRTPTPTVPLR